MNLLVIDSGGRGHALAWKIFQSPRCENLFVLPGNGGTAKFAKNVPIKNTDIVGIVNFAKAHKIDLAVCSQDGPLALGVVDALQKIGVKCWGPTRAAAEIEWSKKFGKEVMRLAGVPTAIHKGFTNPSLAIDCARNEIEHGKKGVYIKGNGLAEGKATRGCRTIEQAEKAIHEFMVEKIYGDAGAEIIIEPWLEGVEVSIHTFCDANGNYKSCPAIRDHKPVFDGDRGLPTGGMGTYSPVPEFTPEMMRQVDEKFIGPVLRELKRRGITFIGCIYFGLMISKSGDIAVLEINARPGDSETQSLMPKLKTDLIDIMEACIDGTLDQLEIEWDDDYVVCVNLASGGYPGHYERGVPIYGIEPAERFPGVKVFHAGTILEDGILKTNGGRVLNVTAKRPTLREAIDVAYKAIIDEIHFKRMHYRTDIGQKSLKSANS